MTILWTLNRLRSMSLPEIFHRVGEAAKKIAAKNRLEGWIRYMSEGAAPILPGLREHVVAFDEETREKVARAALEVSEGRFSALGRKWPHRSSANLFPAELWRLDPVTGKLWAGAEKYCFDIHYRHEQELGDVKYVWEINRLQFLQPLAAQVFLTGDTHALAIIEAAISSWQGANPPFRGLVWSSGIEISLRSITLLIVSSLTGDKLTPETIARIRATLTASLFWLSHYPSLYSSANNHLIAEAAGQYLISLTMPELPRADEVHKKARRILEEEALKQFHKDGVPAEQSPTYGAFSAENLLLCHTSAPLAEPARTRLDLFADFIFALADENGRVPSIGDDDESRVLCFVSIDDTYAFRIAHRIKPPPVPRRMHVFRDGGYSIIRDFRWHIIFDHGPLGYLATAAHGHADALSLCVSLDGKPLLVDPGTYLYHSGGKQRDWFRGTPAHNTLNIRGENQSFISGPFNWSRKAQCRLEEAWDGVDWRIAACHDGYEKHFGVCHRRTISTYQGRLLIKDQLLESVREGEIVFQLAPDLVGSLDGPACQLFREKGTVATILFETPGDVSLCEGLISPAFGVTLSAPRLVWKGKVDNCGVRVTIIPS